MPIFLPRKGLTPVSIMLPRNLTTRHTIKGKVIYSCTVASKLMHKCTKSWEAPTDVFLALLSLIPVTLISVTPHSLKSP